MRTRLLARALVLFALVVVGAPVAQADDPLLALLRRLRATEDPEQRIVLLGTLAATNVSRAAEAVADVVQRDPELKVRRAAVGALAAMPLLDIEERLVALALKGGPRLVRATIARVFMDRPGGAALLVSRLQEPRTVPIERTLLIELLTRFHDDASLSALLTSARDPDPGVREAAWRALAERKDGLPQRSMVMGRLLAQALVDDTGLEVLDAFEPMLTAEHVPLLQPLATAPDHEVRLATRALIVRLNEEARQGAAAPRPAPPPQPPAPVGPADRYGGPKRPVHEEEVPPPPGSAKDRFDLVYACDCTASTYNSLIVLKKRILREFLSLKRLGASVRIGFVGYRDVDANRDRLDPADILLPTPNVRRVEAFFKRLESGGIDRNGASLAFALRTSLAQVPWRWNARRELQVLADDAMDDPKDAILTVGTHFRSDDIVAHIVYVRRTRLTVPPEFYALAAAGGRPDLELLD
jgi:hypothetical protein